MMGSLNQCVNDSDDGDRGTAASLSGSICGAAESQKGCRERETKMELHILPSQAALSFLLLFCTLTLLLTLHISSPSVLGFFFCPPVYHQRCCCCLQSEL